MASSPLPPVGEDATGRSAVSANCPPRELSAPATEEDTATKWRALECTLRADLLRSLEGDQTASASFLRTTSGMLRRYFQSRLRRAPEDAEDLLQETLIAIHRRRSIYDPSYPVSAWIYAIARYRLIDHWRRQGRRGVKVPLEDAVDVFTPAEDVAADAKRDVTRLLSMLPRTQRDCIRLMKLDGLSASDVATRLGMSSSNVKTSSHRGMKTLMRLMASAPV